MFSFFFAQDSADSFALLDNSHGKGMDGFATPRLSVPPGRFPAGGGRAWRGCENFRPGSQHTWARVSVGHRRWTPSASLGHLRTGFRSVWPRVRARPCSWRNSALSGFLIFEADAFSSGPGQRVARAPPEWLPSSPKQEGPSPPSCGTRVAAAAWRGARLCYHRRGGPQREGRVSLRAAFRSSSGERRQCSRRH